MRKISVCIVLGLLFLTRSSMAAIGCTLSNPGQDLKALFPEMTDFKDETREFPKIDKGKELFASLKDRLGGDLDSVYETYDTPYTVYKVYKGKDLIGIVHGVNVPGKGGVIQVFLAMDPNSGEIKNFIFQRIDSPAAKALKTKEFRAQFNGMTLADFYKHDYYSAADPTSDKDKVGKIKEPDVGADGNRHHRRRHWRHQYDLNGRLRTDRRDWHHESAGRPAWRHFPVDLVGDTGGLPPWRGRRMCGGVPGLSSRRIGDQVSDQLRRHRVHRLYHDGSAGLGGGWRCRTGFFCGPLPRVAGFFHAAHRSHSTG